MQTKTPQREPYPEPAAHLSGRAADLWRAIGPTRATTPARRALFQAGLEALDRADLAREEIAREGMTATTKSTGAIHIHPLVKVEREARAQFAAIWGQLKLSNAPQITTFLKGSNHAQ
jgi:phage terminase small subunit